MPEPENLVLEILREMRSEMGEVRTQLGQVHTEVGEVREHMATNVDMANMHIDIAASEKRLSDRITHLQRAVMEYHSSTIGHGLLYSEIDERLRRVEQHLKLPPGEEH